LGKSLRDLSQFPEWKYLVAYVETSRGDILACGTTVFGEGDRLSIVAPYDDIPQLHKFVGDIDRSPLRRIAVFGADRIGSLIVGRLISSEHSSKNKSKDSDNIIMVDANRALCVAAAERFDGIQVLCGDITDENLIAEESLHSCDLMVAASNNYDRNLITASYLKSRGVRRTIALTSGSDFDDISRKLGIDVTIPLRDTFVDCIMSRLRGRNVKSVHTVCNRAFEIVECDVSKDGKVAG
jgi:trk system potassium uptake protein TrkA